MSSVHLFLMSILIHCVKVLLAVGIPERVNPEVPSVLAAADPFLSLPFLQAVQPIVDLLLRQLHPLLILAALEAHEVLRILVVVDNELSGVLGRTEQRVVRGPQVNLFPGGSSGRPLQMLGIECIESTVDME